MKGKLAFLSLIFVYSLALSAPLAYEQPEDCGEPVGLPGWYDHLINKGKVKASAKYQQCFERNRERETRNIERQTAELKNIVFRAHESCHQAIVKIAPNAGTLSFDYAKPFSYMTGLNGSGVYTTEGGYSVQVSGSDYRGRFSLKCYMGKEFNVTGIH